MMEAAEQCSFESECEEILNSNRLQGQSLEGAELSHCELHQMLLAASWR